MLRSNSRLKSKLQQIKEENKQSQDANMATQSNNFQGNQVLQRSRTNRDQVMADDFDSENSGLDVQNSVNHRNLSIQSQFDESQSQAQQYLNGDEESIHQSINSTPPSKVDKKRMQLLQLTPISNGIVVDRETYLKQYCTAQKDTSKVSNHLTSLQETPNCRSQPPNSTKHLGIVNKDLLQSMESQLQLNDAQGLDDHESEIIYNGRIGQTPLKSQGRKSMYLEVEVQEIICPSLLNDALPTISVNRFEDSDSLVQQEKVQNNMNQDVTMQSPSLNASDEQEFYVVKRRSCDEIADQNGNPADDNKRRSCQINGADSNSIHNMQDQNHQSARRITQGIRSESKMQQTCNSQFMSHQNLQIQTFCDIQQDQQLANKEIQEIEKSRKSLNFDNIPDEVQIQNQNLNLKFLDDSNQAQTKDDQDFMERIISCVLQHDISEEFTQRQSEALFKKIMSEYVLTFFTALNSRDSRILDSTCLLSLTSMSKMRQVKSKNPFPTQDYLDCNTLFQDLKKLKQMNEERVWICQTHEFVKQILSSSDCTEKTQNYMFFEQQFEQQIKQSLNLLFTDMKVVDVLVRNDYQIIKLHLHGNFISNSDETEMCVDMQSTSLKDENMNKLNKQAFIKVYIHPIFTQLNHSQNASYCSSVYDFELQLRIDKLSVTLLQQKGDDERVRHKEQKYQHF
eukprot:403352616